VLVLFNIWSSQSIFSLPWTICNQRTAQHHISWFPTASNRRKTAQALTCDAGTTLALLTLGSYNRVWKYTSERHATVWRCFAKRSLKHNPHAKIFFSFLFDLDKRSASWFRVFSFEFRQSLKTYINSVRNFYKWTPTNMETMRLFEVISNKFNAHWISAWAIYTNKIYS